MANKAPENRATDRKIFVIFMDMYRFIQDDAKRTLFQDV